MKYLAIICIITLVGCKNTNSKKLSINIGDKKLFIELADTFEKRKTGLMNRRFLEKNHGMLFVFSQQQSLSFWMKNTLIPLSIAYINEQCILIDIQKMYPYKKNETHQKTYKSSAPARYALETNINWFENNQVKVGDQLSISMKNLDFCPLKK